VLPLLALAPSFLAVALLVVSAKVFPAPGWVGAARHWRVGFLLAAMFYVLLNMANWCSPGWCETFGFPMPYYRSSDAHIVINGWSQTPFSAIGLGVDVGLGATVAIAFGKAYAWRIGKRHAGVA